MLVTAGQRHESTRLGSLLDAIRVPRQGRVGPASAPAYLVADRGGYSYTTCRRLLRQRRITHTIPERSDQQAAEVRRGGVGGHPGLMSSATGSTTWSSGASRPAQATPGHRYRYDKLAVSYHTWLVLADLLLWLPT